MDAALLHSDVDPLDMAAEEFVGCWRRGERCSVEEFAARHPDLAERIRLLFPALVQIELASPAQRPPTGPPWWSGPVPQKIGEYEIVREIGKGGMGVVYEAVQDSLGRHVALKVLPRGRDAGALERFEREARTAAMLHHSNIVPVFAVGEADGLHYYVMQYIRGDGLDSVLRELRARCALTNTAPSTSPSLLPAAARQRLASEPITEVDEATDEPHASDAPWSARSDAYHRQVARLGIQAAQALAYAHAQGVLHRDVKPSNLLLDAQGTLWVTDFGLAKTLGDGDLTRSGDFVGTLRYMAPERFRGRVDRRSDVYSLGLTLYELASLQPAFADSSRDEMIRHVTQSEPERLERREPSIPRDLATIIHKAIAREPDDRYQDAGALAQDLSRFLDDRPILARRSGPLGITWRWCKRNPLPAALVGLLAALLLLGTVGSTIAAYRYNRLARSERNARRIANDARGVADRHASESQAVVRFFINEMVGSAAPDRKLGRDVSVDDVLARADAAIETRFAGQPLNEASIRHTLGMTYEKLGQFDKAERHLIRALELRTRVLGPEHPDTMALTSDLALDLREAAKWLQARDLFERVLEARRRVLGPEHPDTLTSMNFLALLERDLGNWEKAIGLFERVLEARRRVLGPEHPDTLTTMSNLGVALLFEKRWSQARSQFERVLEARQRLLGPEHPRTLDALDNLGHVARQDDRLADALVLYDRVLDARRRVLGPDHPDTLMTRAAVAYSQAGQGRWDQAADGLRAVLATGPSLFSPRCNLAAIELRAGNLQAYRQHAQWLVDHNRNTEDPNVAAQVANICTLLTGAYSDMEQPLELARRAVAANPRNPWFQLVRGAVAYRAGHLAESIASLEQGRGRQKLLPTEAECALFLALACAQDGRIAEARRALEGAEESFRDYDRYVAEHAGQPGCLWYEWALCSALRQEARAAIPTETRSERLEAAESERP